MDIGLLYEVPLPHSVGLLWISDQPTTQNSTCQNSTLRDIDLMAPVGFGPTIAVSERPRTHVLDRAVIGLGT
jgi:hypothetical protein